MADLQFYGMFDYSTGDTDIYEYTSAEWSKLIQGLTDNGVTTGSFSMTASGLNITVGGGTAFINGRYGYNENSTTLTLDACSSSLSRIDRIVLELDVTNRKIAIKIVKGTAASSPAVPSLTQGTLLYQVPLYKAKITNGSTVTLTDERMITYTATEAVARLQTLSNQIAGMIDGSISVTAVYA